MLTFLVRQSLVRRVPAALFCPLGVEFVPSDQVIEGKSKTPINISAEKNGCPLFILLQSFY